ncbi:MAG TPA: hypothetical protein VKR32_12975 [Puia sp.]|nr:hypothetical protein [Puia sp.]
MTDTFESQKNFRASVYTALICALLIALLLLVSWSLPVIQPPVADEGIEVNLGNSDKGSGNNQPFLPGKPSAEDRERYTPPKQAIVEKAPAKDVETNDKEEDAPVVKKPAFTKPDATRLPKKEIEKKIIRVRQPETSPVPVKPKPKAVFHGVNGNGTGGNDADNFKPGGNEGIAGGKGDQGKPGGNPDSKNYSGNGGTGTSGSIQRTGQLANRNVLHMPSFTDDFNQDATVVIDVHVDGAGNVTSAEFHLHGSNTSESSYVDIAKRKAIQVKFIANGQESFGSLIFHFKVHY